jgi:hypothetical protein
MEPESLFPCSQESDMGTCSETDEYIPQPPGTGVTTLGTYENLNASWNNTPFGAVLFT